MRTPRYALGSALGVVFPPDPGWLRLIGAIRTTLGALLTFGLVVLVGGFIPLPVADRVLGFALSLFIGATIRDATRAQQAITMLIAPLPAFAAAALAASLARHSWLEACALVGIVFAATWGASRSPRWGSLGTVALIAFIVALVTHPDINHASTVLLVAVMAAGSAALMRFVVLPERPATELVRLRRAIRRGVARVLAQIEPALHSGTWRAGAVEQLMADVARVCDAAMMAQARLAATSPSDAAAAVSLRIVELELATERMARIAAEDLGPDAERPRLRALVAVLREALAADRTPVPPPAMERLQSHLGRVLIAFAQLLATPLRPITALPRSSAAVAGSGLRPAIQASLSAALAIVGGELLSPSRWYWAAFAAFVLFQGTRSRGESVAKALQFMAGTLAGVVAGVLIATALAGQALASLLALVVAVFLAFDAFGAAYGVMVFWITIVLGLLFGMLGYFAPELLLLRLQETAVGAVCGLGVACFVLVRPTRGAVLAGAEALLPAIGALVSAASAALLAGKPDPAVLGLVLTAEQRWQDLRAAAHPALHGMAGLGNEPLRRRLLFLGVCMFWARELGDASLAVARPPDPVLTNTIGASAARVAASIDDLRTRWQAVSADPPEGELDPFASIPTGLDRDDPGQQAAWLLLRIDGALNRLTPAPLSVAAGPGRRRPHPA